MCVMPTDACRSVRATVTMSHRVDSMRPVTSVEMAGNFDSGCDWAHGPYLGYVAENRKVHAAWRSMGERGQPYH